jgi:hypothetical protein
MDGLSGGTAGSGVEGLMKEKAGTGFSSLATSLSLALAEEKPEKPPNEDDLLFDEKLEKADGCRALFDGSSAAAIGPLKALAKPLADLNALKGEAGVEPAEKADAPKALEV